MKVGLVLAGGFAKGAYQIGALRALEKFIPMEDIQVVSSASIGALNGYAFMTHNLDAAEQMWNNVCNDNSTWFITKLMRSSLLQQNINYLETSGQGLSVPFYCSLLDLMHMNLLYKDISHVSGEDVRQYLKACISLPPYNHSVSIDGVSYFDGGLVDNIPVSPLLELDLDLILCFYFDEANYLFEDRQFDHKVFKIAFPATDMLTKSFLVSQESIEEMIQEGYRLTMEKLHALFAAGYDQSPEQLYQTVEELNRGIGTSSPRLTTDVVISGLNRVTSKFTKRKII